MTTGGCVEYRYTFIYAAAEPSEWPDIARFNKVFEEYMRGLGWGDGRWGWVCLPPHWPTSRAFRISLVTPLKGGKGPGLVSEDGAILRGPGGIFLFIGPGSIRINFNCIKIS